jgi:hypothetical protein
VGVGHAGAGVRRSQDRCSAKESEGDGSERKKTKGIGSTPPQLTLFIEGSVDVLDRQLSHPTF